MNDDDFEIITDKIIKVLQILFLAILCGLGTVLGIFSLIKERKKQMHKIIFEFSETRPYNTTMTVKATNAEIIFAAAALVGDIADNIREKTGEPKEKAEERALTMIQEMLVGHTRKCKNRHQTIGDIK